MLVVWEGMLASFLGVLSNLLVSSWIKLLGILDLVSKGWFPLYVLKWEEVALDFLKSVQLQHCRLHYCYAAWTLFPFLILVRKTNMIIDTLGFVIKFKAGTRDLDDRRCLLYGKKKCEGEWEAPSEHSISNGGFGCGCKGVWIQEKGYCELIWVKPPQKLCINF